MENMSSKIGDSKKIPFFFCDSTLRDGEQVEGVAYTPDQKLEIAKTLDKIGVESIDAGFPATSLEEQESIKKISQLNLNMRIMTMCRINREEIDLALKCGVNGVILFIPGSDIHLKAKFGNDISTIRNKLMLKSKDAIQYAKDKGLFVEYGLEDSTRTEMNFLLDCLNMADEAGADFLGTTDTVGIFTPERMYQFIKKIVSHFTKPIGIHCHNDFGLATANTIAGLLAGGGYCSPTVNGMGERAGNASLEEVIMILKVLYNQELKYNSTLLTHASNLVQQYSGIKTDPFKPVVGKNVFVHESGIHTHGMLKDPHTYEALNPCLVGGKRELKFGKHSGKNLVKHILEIKFGPLSDDDVDIFWKQMKNKEEIGTRYTESDVISQFSLFVKNTLEKT